MKRILLLLGVVVVGTAQAEPRMQPPQAAYDACQNAKAGADCSFTGKRSDTVRGTCDKPEGKMVCVPAERPGEGRGDGPMGNGGGERRGPPPEATAACKDHKSGASCGFTGKRGEQLSGTCRSIESQLACVPRGGPPPEGAPGEGDDAGQGRHKVQ